jgi:ArsR family transcriptional regulator
MLLLFDHICYTNILTFLYILHIINIDKFLCHRNISMKAVMLMELYYAEQIKKLKALADETRLQIVEMLVDGERCACKIQEKFDFTQPTLSYHMKILTDCGLVTGRREGAWMRYTLNKGEFETICRLMKNICENISVPE